MMWISVGYSYPCSILIGEIWRDTFSSNTSSHMREMVFIWPNLVATNTLPRCVWKILNASFNFIQTQLTFIALFTSALRILTPSKSAEFSGPKNTPFKTKVHSSLTPRLLFEVPVPTGSLITCLFAMETPWPHGRGTTTPGLGDFLYSPWLLNGITKWVFPKIGVKPPQNHPFAHRVFHEINHPFWDTPIFGNTQMGRSSKKIHTINLPTNSNRIQTPPELEELRALWETWKWWPGTTRTKGSYAEKNIHKICLRFLEGNTNKFKKWNLFQKFNDFV